MLGGLHYQTCCPLRARPLDQAPDVAQAGYARQIGFDVISGSLSSISHKRKRN